MFDWWDLLALFAVGLLSGSMNSVAGGGSFFSFPVLLSVGLPPVVAQTTNHLGLLPANMMALFPFIKRIKELRYRLLRAVLWCGGAGIAGGLSLILFPPVIFENIVPFLVLGATLLYWAQPRLQRLLDILSRRHAGRSFFLVRGFQVLVAFYCGYFGAGVGFLFLLAFALEGFDEMVDMQCMKNTVVSIISTIVLVVFIVGGTISWWHGLAVFVGAALGGYGGGRVIGSLSHGVLRGLIILGGLGLSVGYILVYWVI